MYTYVHTCMQGVPEVVSGDPVDHTLDILWMTSAACKKNTPLAAQNETKCYTAQFYQDNGMKAKLIDLTSLIRTSGYEVTSPEREGAKFLVGVCRPIQNAQYPRCNGSMACLTQADQSFFLDRESIPINLASIGNAVPTPSLEIESDFPTVTFSGPTSASSACEEGRKVKFNFICPSGNEVKNTTSIAICKCLQLFLLLQLIHKIY